MAEVAPREARLISRAEVEPGEAAAAPVIPLPFVMVDT